LAFFLALGVAGTIIQYKYFFDDKDSDKSKEEKHKDKEEEAKEIFIVKTKYSLLT
jgi:hypothetical protein